MLTYISKQLLYALTVLIGVVITVFLLFQGLPGDPARMTMGQRTDAATIENVNRELALDKPKWQQLLYYINDISPLSVHELTNSNQNKYNYHTVITFGKYVLVVKSPYLRFSYQLQKPVSDMLLQALPFTIVLAFLAILFASIFGIALGTFAALHQNTLLDRLLIFISVSGISFPSFFSAILFQWIFAFVLASITHLPMTGNLYAYDLDGHTHLNIAAIILPVITLGIRPLAVFTQLTRSAMLDVLQMDFIRTARAKGLNKWNIVWRHALRNALNPVVTAISGWFAEMLAGAFFIELVFNWNGLGKLTVDALNKNDFPVVMGSVLIASTLFVVVNLLTDIVYGWIDPRIRSARN
ncbi:MAG: ABC transporter permease [Bacteroidetes bacterium]|nr:ABC transporter permease [Bacteroidota bacterium]